MAKVKSLRGHMDMEVETQGQSVTISVDMEIAQRDQIHSVIIVATPEGEQTVEMIISPPNVYTRQGDEDWVRMDIRYQQTRSAWLDVCLLTKTAGAVLSRRGAY